MYRKRKELPPRKQVPLLEEIEREKIEFGFQQGKRLKRWYMAYLATTLTVVILCVAVLLIGWSGPGYPLLSGQNFGSLASKLAWLDFMDLSWKERTEEEPDAPEQPDVWGDTFAPIIQNPNDGQTPGNPEQPSETDSPQGSRPSLTLQTLYQFDYNAVPEGETPIIPMDLSLTSYGAGYIHNSTGLTPDTEALLQSNFKDQTTVEYLSASEKPLVLIVHTHGTESYSQDGAISYLDDGGELARSTDPKETVVAVGKTLADSLNQRGISTVHCTVMHDKEQYKDSYARAEETIRQYLARYPSIRLVIDLHRDSVVKSTGELVRPVTAVDGEAVAQVMCVVGSDWGGQENPNWQGNLSLALKLREELNQKYQNLCRPAYLRASTYNQELAPYSLLLEVGASGNSLAEAQRSASLIADALAKFIPEL